MASGPPRGSDWRFVGAVSSPHSSLPALGVPEIAFAGRSNVGKSSLINRLACAPGLARTSRTPGRTQQINLFVGRGQIAFVDLPGYGFARVPEDVRAAWKPLVEGYLRRRATLCTVVVIVDARRGVEPDDEQLLEFASACGRPPVLVASKIDKLNQGERARALAAVRRSGHDAIVFSAVTGEGERELWRRLARLAGLR